MYYKHSDKDQEAYKSYHKESIDFDREVKKTQFPQYIQRLKFFYEKYFDQDNPLYEVIEKINKLRIKNEEHELFDSELSPFYKFEIRENIYYHQDNDKTFNHTKYFLQNILEIYGLKKIQSEIKDYKPLIKPDIKPEKTHNLDKQLCDIFNDIYFRKINDHFYALKCELDKIGFKLTHCYDSTTGAKILWEHKDITKHNKDKSNCFLTLYKYRAGYHFLIGRIGNAANYRLDKK